MAIIGATFQTEDQAKEAFRELQDAGIPGDRIGLVMRHEPQEVRREEVRVSNENPVAGAAMGAVLGGSAGWWAAAVGATAVAVPVVGPVLAAGALAAIGVAAGGAAGWLAGSLTQQGMPEPEARHLQDQVEQGRMVMTVDIEPDLVDRARSIIRACGGQESQAI